MRLLLLKLHLCHLNRNCTAGFYLVEVRYGAPTARLDLALRPPSAVNYTTFDGQWLQVGFRFSLHSLLSAALRCLRRSTKQSPEQDIKSLFPHSESSPWGLPAIRPVQTRVPMLLKAPAWLPVQLTNQPTVGLHALAQIIPTPWTLPTYMYNYTTTNGWVAFFNRSTVTTYNSTLNVLSQQVTLDRCEGGCRSGRRSYVGCVQATACCHSRSPWTRVVMGWGSSWAFLQGWPCWNSGHLLANAVCTSIAHTPTPHTQPLHIPLTFYVRIQALHQRGLHPRPELCVWGLSEGSVPQ